MTGTISTTDAAEHVASVLSHIADLIEGGGLPIPLGVTTYCQPLQVQVDADDLGDWLTALDVVQPLWIGREDGWQHAHWEPGTFDDQPFVLSCCRNVGVEAVTA